MGHKKGHKCRKAHVSTYVSCICEARGERLLHDPYLRHNPFIMIFIYLKIRLELL